MIESVQTYKDLCGEIDVLHSRIDDLERELKHLDKLMWANAPTDISAVDYSREQVTNSKYAPSLADIVSRMNKIRTMIHPLEERLKDKEHTRMKIEETLNEFDGVGYKVEYMRAQGKSLIEIADELGYSYSWVRQISSRNKKRTTNVQTY